jgi:hypothetical protein
MQLLCHEFRVFDVARIRRYVSLRQNTKYGDSCVTLVHDDFIDAKRGSDMRGLIYVTVTSRKPRP